MKIHRSCLSLAITLAIGSLPGPLFAAEKESTPEEIVITAGRDKVNLQLMVDQAEDQFFEIFNELIDDEDFRIECKYEKVLGSLIKTRICQTGYMRKELTTAATFNFFGMEYGASAPLTAKNTQLRNKTIELLKNNSELRSAAMNLSERVEEYQDEYSIEEIVE